MVLCMKYSFFMRFSNIQNCLKACEKPGFIYTANEMALADKYIRRLFRFLQPHNPCLVHSFALAQSARHHLKIYFIFPKTAAAPPHAYVQYQEFLFSTANVDRGADNLLIWSKSV